MKYIIKETRREQKYYCMFAMKLGDVSVLMIIKSDMVYILQALCCSNGETIGHNISQARTVTTFLAAGVIYTDYCCIFTSWYSHSLVIVQIHVFNELD